MGARAARAYVQRSNRPVHRPRWAVVPVLVHKAPVRGLQEDTIAASMGQSLGSERAPPIMLSTATCIMRALVTNRFPAVHHSCITLAPRLHHS